MDLYDQSEVKTGLTEVLKASLFIAGRLLLHNLVSFKVQVSSEMFESESEMNEEESEMLQEKASSFLGAHKA